MKLKRILSLFLCFALLLNNFSLAEESEETNRVVMTLEEAVEYAMKNNIALIDADFDDLLEDQEELYNNAKVTYLAWKNRIKSGGFAYDAPADYLNRYGHGLEMSELTYNSFLSTKGGTEETIGYTVKQLSYSVDELKKSINLLEKTILKQEMDVKIAEVKSSLNMITALDVETAKQTLTSTKLQLDSLESALVSLETGLKNFMGLDVSKELEIELPEDEFTILQVENLAKTIEESLKTNKDAIDAKISYKQKEMNNIVATETYFLDRDSIRAAKEAFSDAEFRLNNEISIIKENLISLYNKVKINEESTILAKNEYEQLQIKYKQMQVMYELGMITKHDFNSYEIALINAKNTYEAALHENALLNDRWEIALKYGDVLAKEAEN